MRRRAPLLAFSLAIVQAAVGRVPLKIFTDLGLTPQQIAAIDAGRPVAKVLSWGGPSEVYVFRAVHVEGSSDTYLEAARNVGRLSGFGGIAVVAFGILLIRNPAAVALVMLWLIGSIALVWGAMLLLGGFGVRRLHKQVSA
jgi:hypothetical protein